jgi:hypothetical protein
MASVKNTQTRFSKLAIDFVLESDKPISGCAVQRHLEPFCDRYVSMKQFRIQVWKALQRGVKQGLIKELQRGEFQKA